MSLRRVFSALLALVICLLPSTTFAAAIPTDFNLQVTPSPLVTTIKPGVKSTVELKVRNSGSGTENLKIEPRSFKLSSDSTNINLEDTTPPPVAPWISFSAPKFSVPAGQNFGEQITFNLPKDTGFSYSFALLISRQVIAKPAEGQRAINGSLAVFTLVNVDRPGATSNLQVSSFTASKKVYEYLPATFSIKLHNAGNTITQPLGNVFIVRGNSKTPLDTLTVNETQGYILPGTTRTLQSSWADGFPAYHTVTGSDGKEAQKLVWNWGQLSKLRIGRYTAHLVAVYNQGGRDVPIEGTVSFWVIPWKILLVLLIIVLLILFAVFMLVRVIIRFIKKKRTKHIAKKATKNTSSDQTTAEQ
jgi:hypothetical protein